MSKKLKKYIFWSGGMLNESEDLEGGATRYYLASEVDAQTQALSQPKDAKCPECNDAYSEVCPVCQLDGNPVVEKLRAELNALKHPTAQGWRPIEEHPDQRKIWATGEGYVHLCFESGGKWFEWEGRNEIFVTYKPTHWQQFESPQPPRSEVSNG